MDRARTDRFAAPGFWLLLLLALLTGGSWGARAARAADLTVEATVDRTSVPLDGQLVYTVAVSGGLRSVPDPDLPDLSKDFTVYRGGSSHNFSFVNGQISNTSSISFILVPKHQGVVTIGRALVKANNATYQSQPITVTVTAPQGGGGSAGSGGGGARGTGNGPAPGEDRRGGDREVFITTSVDKREAHIQEQVTLTFRFYQHVNLLESPNYTAPTTTGFWSEDLPPQRTFNEVINGRRYFVTEVKTALFGTAPGKFTIGPAQLDCVVPAATTFDQNDPFSLFGRPMMDGRRMSLKSDPISLTIKSLPPAAPPEFTGAVGGYKVTARLDKSTVPQGEPLTLLLDVSGAGNIKSVSDPAWPAMRDFKVYDSTSSSDVSKEGGVVRGKKSWQQILVPLKAGDLTVAPVRFAYFDPRSDRYEILETSPLNVRVTPAATPAGGGVGTPATRGAIEVVGQDIRFIHTGKTAFQSRGRRAWDGPFFWLMAFLPVGVMAGSLAFDRHRRRLEQDLGFARGVRSGREAGRRLKKARQLLASPDAAFFTETADALRGYVADRFNRAAAGLTLEEIRALLVGRQQRPELIERVVQLLENCDMARYAPAAAASLDRARLLDDAGALIETLKKEGV